jgi:hypothetical protein
MLIIGRVITSYSGASITISIYVIIAYLILSIIASSFISSIKAVFSIISVASLLIKEAFIKEIL